MQARTEGWAAGLQLAALSMQNREDVGEFIAAFTGSHQYIVDYLAEEVVHRQPETVQTFLLQTSILKHMSGALCNALTNRPDGQAMLEALAQANLFVISLDDERHWYRYHHLFRDVLRDRLRHETLDRCPHLHRRAADWYEAQGFAADAIHHALLAGDAAYVAQLVEQYALSMLERGDLTTLLKWIDAVRDQVQERPWLSIYQAWALTLTAQLDQVDSLLQQAELLIQTELLPADAPHILGHIRAIQGYVAAMRGDPTAAVHQAQEALSLLPQQNATVIALLRYPP